MKTTRIIPIGAGLLLTVATIGLAGCYAEPYHRQAPPPHAPAYGARWHADDYIFYPSVGVYFHIHTGYYYYRDGSRWIRSLWLPPRVVLVPRDRVQLRIPDANPWRHHKEYEQRYSKHYAPLPERERHEYDRREREHNKQLYWERRRR